MPPKESRSLWRGLLSVILLGLLGCAGAAAAPSADRPIRIQLPAGPLQQAVEQLADITRLQILYDPDLLRRQVTRGLHGMFTPAKALEQLLAHTDVTFVFTASDAVALHARAKTGTVPAQDGIEVSSQVRTVTITADRNRQLTYDSAPNVSSVKLDEPSLVVPVASASLPQQFLRDQKVVRLDDLVEFVSGTETVPDGQSSSGFEIRGFPTYQYYLDGVRVSPDLHHDGFRDFADIDRVDILKGPASLLYGRTEPGGLINIITKKPLEQPMLALEQQVGSFDYKRTQIDAGGPLTAGGALLYRFNADWENSGSFRDIPENRRIFVAPVITWRVDAATDVTTYLEYLNSHDPSDSGQPVVGDRLPSVPASRSLDEGGEIHTSDLRIGYEASHIFADGWTTHAHVDARWLHAPQAPQLALAADGLAPIQCHPGICPVTRQLVSIPVAQGYTYYASVDATRDFSFWHMRHSVLVDADFFETGAYSTWQTTSDFSLTTDLFDPKPIPLPMSLLDNPDQVTTRNTGERWYALYSQDQVQIGASLYLLVGLRFDDALARTSQNVYSGFASPYPNIPYSYNQTTVHSFRQREGIVWRVTSWSSLYAIYAQNFGVTPGLYVGADSQNALTLPPQSAEELEAGVKLGLADDRINATLAVFSLTKQNVASTLLEPALDGSGLLFLTGTVRNRGLEFDVHGEVLPGMQLLASYAYIDSRIYNGPFTPEPIGGAVELIGTTGDRLFGVPRNGGSLWTSYRIPGGTLKGLKLGAGGIARSAREGDNANNYVLPGFVKWNVFASHDWRVAGMQVSTQLNVDNIFNKSYYESLSGTRTVMPGYPRRWLASLRLEF
jgi:iron complex outermembrane receptor protein